MVIQTPKSQLAAPRIPRDDPKGRSQGTAGLFWEPQGGSLGAAPEAERGRGVSGGVSGGLHGQPAVPQALGVGSSQDRAVLKRRLKELSAAAQRERKAREKAEKQREKQKKKDQEQRRS